MVHCYGVFIACLYFFSDCFKMSSGSLVCFVIDLRDIVLL